MLTISYPSPLWMLFWQPFHLWHGSHFDIIATNNGDAIFALKLFRHAFSLICSPPPGALGVFAGAFWHHASIGSLGHNIRQERENGAMPDIGDTAALR